MKTNPIYEAFKGPSVKFQEFGGYDFTQLEAWWMAAMSAAKGPIRKPDGGIHIELQEMAFLLMYAGAMGGVTQSEWNDMKQICAKACATFREQGRTSTAMAKIQEAFKEATVMEVDE